MPDAIHVLVVDDDTNVRGLLVAVLSRSPFTVVDAASGGEAMAHLAREEFDVALVDIQLPDHSGLDILRWARDADVDAELIVLTRSEERRVGKECRSRWSRDQEKKTYWRTETEMRCGEQDAN